MWRKFNRNNPNDINLIKEICKKSGSKSVRGEVSYIDVCLWRTKDNPDSLWCYIYNDCAFYLCIRCKKHIRGALTVVREDMHRKGVGKLINNHRLVMMKRAGIDTFKFRTNRNEDAIKFWLAQGGE